MKPWQDRNNPPPPPPPPPHPPRSGNMDVSIGMKVSASGEKTGDGALA